MMVNRSLKGYLKELRRNRDGLDINLQGDKGFMGSDHGKYRDYAFRGYGKAEIPRVVVNADDFGIHEAINEGIIRGYEDGIVSSTSIMPCGLAFDEGVERLRMFPGLGVGVHLTLVEERPILSAQRIPSLVTDDGRFPRSYGDFLKAYIFGRIKRGDLQSELEAQVERVVKKGIRPTHLDSHQHIHCLPYIWKMVVGLASRYRIPFIRLPNFNPVMSRKTSVSVLLARAGINTMGHVYRSIWDSSVKFSDQVVGLSVSGRLNKVMMLQYVNRLRKGLTEIVVHPGVGDDDLKDRYRKWKYNWEQELNVLTDPLFRQRCRRGDFILIDFNGRLRA